MINIHFNSPGSIIIYRKLHPTGQGAVIRHTVCYKERQVL